MKVVGLIAFLMLAGLPAAQAAEAPVLEKLVLLQRHGVRSPTKPPEAYAAYAGQAWPDWPVAPGILTPHGRRDIALMAGWLRSVYAGLLGTEACPAAAAVSVWADGGDERTRDSGQAFLDGAFPGCGLMASHGPEGRTDPLFDGVSSGACPVDPVKAQKALADALKKTNAEHALEIEAGKTALAEVLAPSDRNFLQNADSVQSSKSGAKLEGPLAVSASLAENLLLEYAQGLPSDQVGWGRAGQATLERILPLHNIASTVTRRTPYLASHNGALLAQAMLAKLRGHAALSVIAGHDTNLSNLAGILGVSWVLPGQPDDTAPGTAMAIELWRTSGGEHLVKLRVFYQPLEAMRTEAPPPYGSVAVAMPGCGPEGCSLAAFVRQVENSLPAECLSAQP